jgi:dihydroflavonol-4-reductase
LKVLVAGATGFIGSYILRYLVRDTDHTVLGLCRSTSSFDLVIDIKDQVEWEEADIRDIADLSEIIKEVDVVINATGVISHKRKELEAINVEAVANLVNLCLHHQCQQFIHISSVSALGGYRGRPIDEHDYWPEKSIDFDYGLSKYLGEQEVWRADSEGLRVTIINPSLVIGAGYWGVFPDIITTIHKGLSLCPIGSTGIVDVRDVAAMTVLAIDNDQMVGQRFICSADNVRIRDLSTEVAQELGVRAPHRLMKGATYWIIKRVVRILNLFHLMNEPNVQFLEFSQLLLSYDSDKSKELGGFEYRPIHQSIKETSQVFLETYRPEGSFGTLPLD